MEPAPKRFDVPTPDGSRSRSGRCAGCLVKVMTWLASRVRTLLAPICWISAHHIGEAAELRLLQLDDIQRRLEVVDGLVAEIVGEHECILAVAGGVEGISRAADQDLMGIEGWRRRKAWHCRRCRRARYCCSRRRYSTRRRAPRHRSGRRRLQ